ncbi:MAG TPA: hypothetical protein VG317_20585 [Pseudonocardiaceae bacterium]|nr:hypothetical protein [Pseudonocardiaceae bacterium]
MNARIVDVTQWPEGLFAQIQAGVNNPAVSLSSILQQCLMLGRRSETTRLLDWAQAELGGYVGANDLPSYRHISSPLMAMITNLGGFNGITQRIDRSVFPQGFYEIITKKFELEDATLSDGVGMLEALASQDVREHTVGPVLVSVHHGHAEQVQRSAEQSRDHGLLAGAQRSDPRSSRPRARGLGRAGC